MNAVEKAKLSREADMQIKALQKISLWRSLAIALSTIGVAVAYAGISGAELRIFLGILGVTAILLGTSCALILNKGLVNGRKNVEKILNVLEHGAETI